MRIVSRESIKIDYTFPKDPTHEQIESALYMAEAWTAGLDEEKEATVVSFSDIKEFFDGWDQCEDDRYDTVYDYITDCLHWYGGAFWPCSISE